MIEPTFMIEASIPTDERTALMSNAALGCYIKLMCFAWREGSIPENPALLARLCGETASGFAGVWPQMEKCFAIDVDRPGRLVHAGLDRQKDLVKASRAAKSVAGAIGAKKRWSQHKATVPTGQTNAEGNLQSPPQGSTTSVLVRSDSAISGTGYVPATSAPDTGHHEARLPGVEVDLFGPVDAPPVQVPRDPHRLPPCPHEQIISLYHELLPLNPTTLTWSGTRRGYLVARWKDMATTSNEELGNGYQTVEDGLKWWRAFLTHCAKSRFLTGQTEGRNQKPPFVANLEWIVKPSNFAKILEGIYHRG